MLLNLAAAHLPDKAAEIGKFKEQFDKIADEAKEPMQISLDTPGLIHGIGIQPIDLIQMGHGASLATEVDTHVHALIGDMNRFNEELLAANAGASQGLNVKASQAVTSMALVGIVSTLLAGAFALWMSTFKISRPLVRMVERMRALAHGDLEVEIDGLERGDEVGEMANAVQVFKTNAIERVRVEKEASEHRAEVETERRRVEAREGARRRDADPGDEPLGDGLRRLAGGDLTSRLDQRFPTEFAKIRDDFNSAARKLMETVRAVVASTSAIHAGSHEISTSSDDLSQPHRAAGGAPRGDGGGARRDHRDAEEVGRGRQAGGGRGRQRRRQRQEGRGRRQAGGRGDGRDRQIVGRRSARSSASSTRSRSRPICWRSTPASRRRAPATPAAASRSSPPRCARSPSVRRKPPRRSRA